MQELLPIPATEMPKKRRRRKKKSLKKKVKKKPILVLSRIDPSIKEKKCTKCKEIKLLSEFYIRKEVKRKPAYASECKKCYAKRAPAKLAKKRKQTVLYRSPENLQRSKENYHKNKDKHREYQRLFIEKNPDYFRQKSREKRAKQRLERIEGNDAMNDRDFV